MRFYWEKLLDKIPCLIYNKILNYNGFTNGNSKNMVIFLKN